MGGEEVTNYHDAALSMEPWDREPNSDHDVDSGGVGGVCDGGAVVSWLMCL